MSRPVDAVTFDFWNTLMWEKSGSLKEKRLEVWSSVLPETGLPVPVDLADAHDAAHESYVASWRAGKQFRVGDAVRQMLESIDGFARRADVADALAAGFSEAGRRAAVRPTRGLRECLESLKAAGIRIGIICDIGLTPSPIVCELLERHGLLPYFDGMSFSDEVGQYKPSRRIFEHALATLGRLTPERAAHVGDRRRTDVAGAIAIGMTAVRYNGVYDDDDVSAPEADIVIGDLSRLPRALGLNHVLT